MGRAGREERPEFSSMREKWPFFAGEKKKKHTKGWQLLAASKYD